MSTSPTHEIINGKCDVKYHVICPLCPFICKEHHKTKTCSTCDNPDVCFKKVITPCQRCGFTCCSNGSQNATSHTDLTPLKENITQHVSYIIVCYNCVIKRNPSTRDDVTIEESCSGLKELKQKSKEIILKHNCMEEIIFWMHCGDELNYDSKEFIDRIEMKNFWKVELLRDLVLQNPISEEMIFYRGFKDRENDKLKQGLEIESKYITAITACEEVAPAFGPFWKVILPKGTPCLYISILCSLYEDEFSTGKLSTPGIEKYKNKYIDSEKEALLGPGYFKIISLNNSKNWKAQFEGTIQFYLK